LVGQLLVEALVGGERRRCRDQQGVAVGLRLRHQRSTDVAAAAAAVLYDDWLAPLRLQLVADDSGKHVVGATAGIRNEKFYRSCWVPLLRKRLVGTQRGNHRRDEDEGEGGNPSDHGHLRRARSESIGDKDAKATSIAVAGQVALHTGAGGN